MPTLNLLLLKPILRVKTGEKRGGVGREKRLQRENNQCFMLDRQKERETQRERKEEKKKQTKKKIKERLTCEKAGTVSDHKQSKLYKRHFTS